MAPGIKAVEVIVVNGHPVRIEESGEYGGQPVFSYVCPSDSDEEFHVVQYIAHASPERAVVKFQGSPLLWDVPLGQVKGTYAYGQWLECHHPELFSEWRSTYSMENWEPTSILDENEEHGLVKVEWQSTMDRQESCTNWEPLKYWIHTQLYETFSDNLLSVEE